MVEAGWYDDPWGQAGLRWWDGTAWTGHAHPAQPPTATPGLTGLLGGAERCAVIDVETTGLSLESDSIIEFALRRIHFDGDGIVTNIEPAHVWREDPGCPIPAEVTRLTGLTDDHVKDQRIDEDEVLSLLGGSDLLIAHFAAFDGGRSAIPPRANTQAPSQGSLCCDCPSIRVQNAVDVVHNPALVLF